MPFLPGQAANPAGRPKGILNKATQLQREVAERIFGKPGSPEFNEFIKRERASLLDGTMPPAIKIMWAHYNWGKVADRIEVADIPPSEFDGIDENALRERARNLAVARFAPVEIPVEEKEPTIQ